MKTPFHTNIGQLEKELEHLRMHRTRTFTKINLQSEDNLSRLRMALVKLDDAIHYLKDIKTK